ncbi:MAG: tail fiber domain-containing protein [Bacteroidota bacterium]
MPDPITGLIVGGTQLVGGLMQADAAGEAAGVQAAASEAGIAEQRRQFDMVRELLKPYVEAGAPALAAQQAMLGLGTPEAEAAQIAAAERSPTFQAMLRTGEEALLQRASATGGLRGGNVQAALAQFRPQLLAQELEQRYSRLGGLTSLGQQSAAGVGTAGMETGSAIARLQAERGAALAGGELGEAKAFSGILNLPAQVLGMQYGAGGKMGQPGLSNIFSDRRLKKNIKQIGTRPDGLNVYEFDYIWGGDRQVGLMAQEVQGVYPDAVSESGGYLMVDYSKV